jgi:sec-independent protein translocase protein TatA
MFGLGAAEVLVLLLVGLLLFGNQLPRLARSLGKTVVEFRREVKDFSDDLGSPSQGVR